MGKAYTLWCPNCDAKLPARVWDGQDWDCAECGERGTFKATLDTMTSTLRHKHIDDLARWSEMTITALIQEVGVFRTSQIIAEIAEMVTPLPPDDDVPF